MDEPRMPALLVRHHRPGFYFRVLQEGHVRAGDEIVKVADGPEGMTVAEVDALLYLPGHPRDRVERALRIPALSPGWQGSSRAILDEPESASGNAGLVAAAPPPSWTGFRPLLVTAIETESTTTSSVRLAAPDGTPVPAALPGQFPTVRVRPGLVRSYSLSGPAGAAGYRISVKRQPHGEASSYLHTQLHPGDLVDVAAPRGSFVLRPATNPVLLISGGVGATPVPSMLHALAAQRSPPRGVVAPGRPRRRRAAVRRRGGLTVPWPAGCASLLDLAEACDVPVRWSCRSGVCHTCDTGLLSGAVDYTAEPVDPPAEGDVLICSARPQGPVVLDL